jgi:uncharacterized membrane protein YbaN (DUF454 family)
MALDSILAAESVGVPGSVAVSAWIPAVPGSIPEADTAPGVGSITTASATERLDAGAGVWIECDQPSGMVEIHDPRLFRPGRESFCRALARSALEDLQARRVEISLASSTCRLEFTPGEFDQAALARRAAAAVTAATPALVEQPRAATRDVRPLVDLVLAGGSLTMAVAGAVLPGIPSLPFLVLTVRHAARVSPQFDEFLRRQSWAAALLDHADNTGSILRLDAERLPQVLLCTVFAAAMLMILHPPLPVVMALELGVMAFVCYRGTTGQAGAREMNVGVPA